LATFAGYLVFGLTGAIVATAAVFPPVYLFATAADSDGAASGASGEGVEPSKKAGAVQ